MKEYLTPPTPADPWPGPLPQPEKALTPCEAKLDPNDGESCVLRFPADTTDPGLQAILHVAAYLNRITATWVRQPRADDDLIILTIPHES